MKKLSIYLLISLLISFSAMAQRKLKQLDEDEAQKKEQYEGAQKNKFFDPKKWTFGGNLGGSIYANGYFFMAQPIAGYMIAEKTMLGVGATYMFQSQTYNGKKYTHSIYGPILFARQLVLEQFFAHIEYQPLNYGLYSYLTNGEKRQWENILYAGAGYGGKKGAYLIVLYNLLWNENTSLYYSPWDIRMGILF